MALTVLGVIRTTGRDPDQLSQTGNIRKETMLLVFYFYRTLAFLLEYATF